MTRRSSGRQQTSAHGDDAHHETNESLAHDLRSSLASASFAAELLETALDDPERVADLAATIKQSLERTQQIIRSRMK